MACTKDGAAMNVLAFDIETVPDVDGGRKLLSLGAELSDSDVAEAMFAKRREKTGNDFIATHLQRVVAISAVYRNSHKDQFSVWTIGKEDSSESDIVQNFFDGIDKHTPTLVTWNGSGFDLPVLHYRALIHGVQASRYWELGEDDTNFRWNNYIGRFHLRHTDLMDVLAGYNNRAFAPLDEIAVLLGLPGKMGMSGAHVWSQYKAGEIKAIRDYCETDALNTYLVYLHWQAMRGQLDAAGLKAEQEVVRSALRDGEPHLKAFLEAWENGSVD
ncbi:3'-5' exonuclease [Arenicella xantha]